jgi:hypothetical protein
MGRERHPGHSSFGRAQCRVHGPFMGQYAFYQVNEFSAYVPTGVTLSVSAKE